MRSFLGFMVWWLVIVLMIIWPWWEERFNRGEDE